MSVAELTARGWFEANRASVSGVTRKEAQEMCAKETGKCESVIREAYAQAFVKAFSKPQKTSKKVVAETPAGLGSLAERFSASAKARRKAGKMHASVDILVDSELKKREWMTDREMQQRSGISRDDWTNLRRDYEDLILQCTGDDGRRETIWVHPNYRNKAMELINQ
jgi:hypothetical protein